MDLKHLIFYLAIFFFFFRFNPFFPYGLPVFEFAYFIGSVSGGYIAVFLIYEFILNFDKIKGIFAKGQNSLSTILVEKSPNQKRDLIKFLILSILIFLGIDIIFTKISNQSIYQYFVNYIPGLKETMALVSLKPETIDPSALLKDSGFAFDPKFQNIKEGLSMFIGPMVGAMLLFSLRQLNNRSKSAKQFKHPGARILTIFLLISMFILIVDIYRDREFSGNIFLSSLKSVDPFTLPFIDVDDDQTDNLNGKNNTLFQDGEIILYEVEFFAAFMVKLVFSIPAVVSIISIWFFDWYIFSKLWEQK